jgi:hypothetical protein
MSGLDALFTPSPAEPSEDERLIAAWRQIATRTGRDTPPNVSVSRADLLRLVEAAERGHARRSAS